MYYVLFICSRVFHCLLIGISRASDLPFIGFINDRWTSYLVCFSSDLVIKLWCLCHGVSTGKTTFLWPYCQRSIHLQCCQYHAFCFTHVWDILEYSDIWWCACWLHLGRMEFVGYFPEDSLQRCDAGDLWKPYYYR